MATEDWKSWVFRQRVQQQLDELIRNSPSTNQRNAQDLEAQVFQRAKTRDEYLQFIARIVMHMRGVASDTNMNRGNNPNITAVLNNGPGVTQGQMGSQGPGQPGQPGGQQPGGGQFGGPGGNIVVLPSGMQQNPGPGQGGGPRMQGNMNINISNQGGGMNEWQNSRMPMAGKQENINIGMQGGKMTQMPITMGAQGGPVNQVPPQMMNNMPRSNVSMPPGMTGSRVPSPGFSVQTSTGPRPGPSPIGGATSTAPMASIANQPSPAFVSPSPSSTMVPSPVGMMNTSGQPQHPSTALTSSGQLSDSERAYRAKVQQLSKYVEPLRRMIQRIQDAEKLSKMKKLFDMLQNPQRRMPLETLIKCETVLEKLEISREDGPVGPQVPPSMEGRIAALLEAVGNSVKAPCGAHSLNRTISPALSVLLGPTLCPPPIKKMRKDPDVQTPPEAPNISDVVQGEVARLNSRFRVNVDCQQPPGSDDLTLICQLDDPNLPCVPPITMTIPWDYPEKPPRCELQAVDYDTTDFLRRIREVALVRLRNMPPHCSLTMLLHSWEMSVRQACSPKPLTDNPVLNSFAITGF